MDLDARELYPEIKQAFDEDRLEAGWIHLDDIHRQWEMPRVPSDHRTDGIYLPLLCKDCGRTREHFTEYVLVDINTFEQDDDEKDSKYDAHILDHEVICPKCRAVDCYEMTSTAYLRITGPDDIFAMFQTETGKKKKKLRPNPRVFYFRSVAFGEKMHPLDGLDEYRRRIALNPNDAQLHTKMGSLLRTLMRYPEALQAMRHAYQLDPDDSDIIMRLALAEHDLGDRETARTLYQKIIDQENEKPFSQQANDDVVGAIEGLRNLKHNRPSPSDVTLLLRDGTPVEHPSLSWRRAQALGQSPAKSPKQPKGKTKRGRRGRRKR
jgi:tetratricopeptide (TPR) repeat protein